MLSYLRCAVPHTSDSPLSVWNLVSLPLTSEGLPKSLTKGYNVYIPTSLNAPAVPGMNEEAISPLFSASYLVEY